MVTPGAIFGKGVTRAVAHVNGEIADALRQQDLSQRDLDLALIRLDGTANKGRLGANALLGVSMAALKADAIRSGRSVYAHIALAAGQTTEYCLPVPMMNILNGGAHADSNVDFQEFMVMPLGAPSFREGLRIGVEIFHSLRGLLKKRGLSTGVGDEGGFAPNLRSNREAVEVVLEAVEKAGFRAGADVYLALDVASSEFWAGNSRYEFKKSGEPARDSEGMVSLYVEWCREYPIISIEDGCAEGDWRGWAMLTKELGARVQLVGDDVFVTNPEILDARDQRRNRERFVGQAQSNRHGDRDVGRNRDCVEGRLRKRHLASLRRNRRLADRRPGSRDVCRPDQNRFGLAQRSDGQIQPVTENRRGIGPRAKYAGRTAIKQLR